MVRGLVWVLGIILALAPLPALAQEFATLVADKVWVDGNSTLNAEGNVEILYGTSRIKAARITYDRTTGALHIEGPITLTEGDGTVILADSAELDADLQNGILRGARLVLEQQLQLAAVEIHRVDGRYTQLYKTVASSCQVCANNPVPLWQIRARRIIHDREARQLYFENAVLRVMDVPVFYLPRLRMPDPSQKRATGFLVPELKSSSNLGLGLKIPYFIRLGDHADLTVTPYLATKTTTLELGFRRAFRTGDISFQSALSSDDTRPGQDRGYFFGEGRFELPRDYILSFDLELTSDRDYLVEYDYSNKDRLDSAIGLHRARRDKLVAAQFIHYKTLRAAENNLTQPTRVTNLTYHQRFEPALFGGEASVRFESHSHFRRSDTPGDDGRDLSRASLRLGWQRGWTMQNGMFANILGELNTDFYSIKQGLPGELNGSHLTPVAAVTLRWPFSRNNPRGASQVIEPVVQLVWSDEDDASLPNEDSRLVEFDEGNLFSLSRFPGADRYERGLRANLGVTWTRYDPKGWSLGLTVGRILRYDDLGQFSPGTGLTGNTSDWLTVVQLMLPDNLTLTNRAVFDDRFEFAKNETRLSWHTKRLGIGSSYIWMEAEPFENRPGLTSEWTFDAAYDFTPYWTAKTDWRYDFNAGSAAYAGIGLEYRNECVKVDLSLSRRFTSSGSLTPATEFGLKISLNGFGTGGSGRAMARSCQK